MKAITLSQPWAELVAVRRKRYETRSWPTNYRGVLAVHAGRRGSGGLGERELAAFCDEFDLDLDGMAFGAIIALGALASCETTTDVAPRIRSFEYAAGDYSPGRFAWLLEDVRRLSQPIPCKGSLGLWNPPPDVLAQLAAAVVSHQEGDGLLDQQEGRNG